MKALLLVLSGCLSLAHWAATSKLLWLAVGLPVVAVGLWVAELRPDPVAALRRLARWIDRRASDLEIILAMAREAPAVFAERRRA